MYLLFVKPLRWNPGRNPEYVEVETDPQYPLGVFDEIGKMKEFAQQNNTDRMRLNPPAPAIYRYMVGEINQPLDHNYYKLPIK